MTNQAYYLHGVCIHDGTAESGHYYSYIKDHNQGVWRCYNDHRVTNVEEKLVFEEASGGGLTKSAYYVIYISERELQHSKTVDGNLFVPGQALDKLHPYASLASEQILAKIRDDNRKLQTEVDNYKASEIAKKVTTCYEKTYDEISKILEQKIANKDIGSFYTYLLSNKNMETQNLGKRLLVDQSFLQETGQRPSEMERVQGILVKIEEKAMAKPASYPNGRFWMDPQDRQQVE